MSSFYSATPALQAATLEAFDIAPKAGGYFEFGLFRGFNLCFAELCSRGRDYHLYGFDSFQGMPANSSGQWLQGEFCASLEEVQRYLQAAAADMSRITLIKGWFKDVLPTLKVEDFRPAGVVVIDSDLYESCVEVLRFMAPLLRAGTVILFDDWQAYGGDPDAGEQRAWREFLADRPVKTHDFIDFGKYGHGVVLEEWDGA